MYIITSWSLGVACVEEETRGPGVCMHVKGAICTTCNADMGTLYQQGLGVGPPNEMGRGRGMPAAANGLLYPHGQPLDPVGRGRGQPVAPHDPRSSAAPPPPPEAPAAGRGRGVGRGDPLGSPEQGLGRGSPQGGPGMRQARGRGQGLGRGQPQGAPGPGAPQGHHGEGRGFQGGAAPPLPHWNAPAEPPLSQAGGWRAPVPLEASMDREGMAREHGWEDPNSYWLLEDAEAMLQHGAGRSALPVGPPPPPPPLPPNPALMFAQIQAAARRGDVSTLHMFMPLWQVQQVCLRGCDRPLAFACLALLAAPVPAERIAFPDGAMLGCCSCPPNNARQAKGNTRVVNSYLVPAVGRAAQPRMGSSGGAQQHPSAKSVWPAFPSAGVCLHA